MKRIHIATAATVAAVLAAAVAVSPAGSVVAAPGGRPSATPSWSSPKPVNPRPVQPLTIMTGFDSITEDVDNNAYRDELSAMLTVPHTYAVTAISGTGCDYWAPKIDELLNLYNPAVVLINCGTNDSTLTVEDRERLGSYYRIIVEAIHAHNPGTYIIASKIQISRVDPNGPLAWLPPNEIRANEVIEFNMNYYIPAWPTVGMVDFSTIEATVVNNPDGIHPGVVGQQLYANLWYAEGQRLGAW